MLTVPVPVIEYVAALSVPFTVKVLVVVLFAASSIVAAELMLTVLGTPVLIHSIPAVLVALPLYTSCPVEEGIIDNACIADRRAGIDVERSRNA